MFRSCPNTFFFVNITYSGQTPKYQKIFHHIFRGEADPGTGTNRVIVGMNQEPINGLSSPDSHQADMQGQIRDHP
jgi:hypothetical protein